MLGHVAAGPRVPFAEGKPGLGGEATASAYIDVNAGAEWLNGQPQPETAGRFGIAPSAYIRASNQGFGIGIRPGFFFGSTNGQMIFLADGAAELGLETLHTTAYGAVGAVGSVTAGFVVSKSYDPKAYVLCRSLGYLTFTGEGALDYLPAAKGGPVIPSVSLLVGWVALDDGGSPSDRGDPASKGRCPR